MMIVKLNDEESICVGANSRYQSPQKDKGWRAIDIVFSAASIPARCGFLHH
jgi:hypothetical protein